MTRKAPFLVTRWITCQRASFYLTILAPGV